MLNDILSFAARHDGATPLGEVAEMVDLDVVYKATGPHVSGTVRFEFPKFIAEINKHDPDRRQRFSLAHEIGHIVYHADKLIGGGVAHRDVFIGGRRNPPAPFTPEDERTANNFAANLLMPEAKLKRWELDLKAKGTAIDGTIIERWANQLDVSELALRWRLWNLKIIADKPIY